MWTFGRFRAICNSPFFPFCLVHLYGPQNRSRANFTHPPPPSPRKPYSHWENLNGGGGGLEPNFQRKSGENPSCKIGPFQGKLGPFQGLSAPFRGPAPHNHGERAEIAPKGPFLPQLAPFGPSPRLLSPRLDFPNPILPPSPPLLVSSCTSCCSVPLRFVRYLRASYQADFMWRMGKCFPFPLASFDLTPGRAMQPSVAPFSGCTWRTNGIYKFMVLTPAAKGDRQRSAPKVTQWLPKSDRKQEKGYQNVTEEGIHKNVTKK